MIDVESTLMTTVFIYSQTLSATFFALKQGELACEEEIVSSSMIDCGLLEGLASYYVGPARYSFDYWAAFIKHLSLSLTKHGAITSVLLYPKRKQEADHIIFLDLPTRSAYASIRRGSPFAKFHLCIIESPSNHIELYDHRNYDVFSTVVTREYHLFHHPCRRATPLPCLAMTRESSTSSNKQVHKVGAATERLQKACLINKNRAIGLLSMPRSRSTFIRATAKRLLPEWKLHPWNIILSEWNDLYRLRRSIARSQEGIGNERYIDVYGEGWGGERISLRDALRRPKPYCAWMGITEEPKDNIMSRYIASFAIENIRSSVGYVSEKLFDALRNGCTTVYFGDKKVENLVPKDVFISCQSRKDVLPAARSASIDLALNRKLKKAFADFDKSSDSTKFSLVYWAEVVCSTVMT